MNFICQNKSVVPGGKNIQVQFQHQTAATAGGPPQQPFQQGGLSIQVPMDGDTYVLGQVYVLTLTPAVPAPAA